MTRHATAALSVPLVLFKHRVAARRQKVRRREPGALRSAGTSRGGVGDPGAPAGGLRNFFRDTELPTTG
jgi:hypothetical protein